MLLPLIDLPSDLDTSTSVETQKHEYCVKCTSVELFEEHKKNAFDLSKIFQSKNFDEGISKYFTHKENSTWFEIEDDSMIADYELFVRLPIKKSKRIKVKVKSVSRFVPQISI